MTAEKEGETREEMPVDSLPDLDLQRSRNFDDYLDRAPSMSAEDSGLAVTERTITSNDV